MVEVNIKRVARQCRMMLDSSTAHMLAVGPIKHLNAYLYAAMVRGAVEPLLDSIDDERSEAYQQLRGLDVEAIKLCEQFERDYKVFNVTTESGKELTVAAVPDAPKPNGHTIRPDRNLKTHTPGVGNGKHKGDRSHRLELHERIAIWDHFNGAHAKRPITHNEIVEAAVMYDCTTGTIQYWIDNNPHKDVKSM